MARPVDHCVIPVADLDFARSRFQSLGFTVAADAVHPFGTSNACVYLSDDTYLEPLAVADAGIAGAAARKGNVFVARDAAWRFRNGQDGFSAVALATNDAAQDHGQFVKNGMTGGRILRFSRGYRDADGKRSTISFRLAFAADLRAPDASFFTCQRINAPAAGRGSLVNHPNGVLGLAEIVVLARDPAAWLDFLEKAFDAPSGPAASGCISISAGNANIALLNAAGLKNRYGITMAEDPGLRLVGLRFHVADHGRAQEVFHQNEIGFEELENTCAVVPSAVGQDVFFAFSGPGKL